MAKVIPLPAAETSQSSLPSVYRLQSLSRQCNEEGKILHKAKILNEPHRYSIHWVGQDWDPLRIGGLYAIEWAGWPIDDDGSLSIGGLVPVTAPDPEVNLFRTLPERWVPDRSLVARGAMLWEQLPPGLKSLFNAIFWDAERFRNYVCGPSSYNHHHSRRNGNLSHSLEVAQLTLDMAKYSDHVDQGLLIMAALLHDAAKAEEYRLSYEGTHQGWSEAGTLLGHRLLVYGWIEAAMAAHAIEVPQRQLLSLKHILLATEGIAAWTSFPQPRMLEAKLLSAADRASGETDLFARLAPENGGFGTYHKSMNYPPYFSELGQPVGD